MYTLWSLKKYTDYALLYWSTKFDYSSEECLKSVCCSEDLTLMLRG